MIQGYAIAGLVSLAMGFSGGYWLCHTKGKADRMEAAEDRAQAAEARMDATLDRMLAENRQAIAERLERAQHQQDIRLQVKARESRIEHIVAAEPSDPLCVLPAPWVPVIAQGHDAAAAALDRLR